MSELKRSITALEGHPIEDAEGRGLIAALAKTSVAMPKGGDRVDHGTAGQFAVSDGKGGITWKTLVEAEAVMY